MSDFWSRYSDILGRLGEDDDDTTSDLDSPASGGAFDPNYLALLRPQPDGINSPDPVPLPYWRPSDGNAGGGFVLLADASGSKTGPTQTGTDTSTGDAQWPLAQYAANAGNPDKSSDGTNSTCPANVRDFVNAHWQDAQKLADQLGNGVTPAEVLGVAGNETGWGQTGFTNIGNYFGIHGSGPEGSQPAARSGVPVAKFPVDNGFMSSGQALVNKVQPYMTPEIGNDPHQFYTVLNQHGWATGNSGYPDFMVRTGSNRGPFTLAQLCAAKRP